MEKCVSCPLFSIMYYVDNVRSFEINITSKTSVHEALTHLEQMTVPIVVRVLGVRWKATGHRHAVGDAFQGVHPAAPLVGGGFVIENCQIVRADLLRLSATEDQDFLFFSV